MTNALLLFLLLIQDTPSPEPEARVNLQLECVILKTDERITQLFAFPQKNNGDNQAFADKLWPLNYIHDLGVIVNPPGELSIEVLSVLEITKHQSLKTIDLSGTNVTDDDLLLLSSLPDLECLVLDATDVSDEGLKHLEKLRPLRLLSLHGCNVTVDAIRSFRSRGVVVITGDGQTTVPIGHRR